jgi:uncharacterized protein
MNRRDFALAALSGAQRQSLTPVQLQKLLFILDRNIGDRVAGSGFDFQPYHYGPFDRAVYSTLEQLASEGLAQISDPESSRRQYSLTDTGQELGDRMRSQLGPAMNDYFGKVCDFVRTQSFAGLVSSIYKAFPDMKVNSVFRE